jgi:glycosyltransferase involved in cell wall biosynthesis
MTTLHPPHAPEPPSVPAEGAPVAITSVEPIAPPGRMLVVIPAFNEEAHVEGVIRDVNAILPTVDVLVVDDGSSDHTARVAGAAGARVLQLPVNLGYGAALQAGYKYAVRQSYDFIGQIDADGQHLAEHFGDLLEGLADPEVHVVVGSRFLDHDGHYVPSRARRFGMSLFGWMASRATGQNVSDPTSGFQVLRADVARFFCTDVYPSDYPDADILILLYRAGFNVREVGVRMRHAPGDSMHSGHHSLYYVYKMTLSILMTLLRPKLRKER